MSSGRRPASKCRWSSTVGVVVAARSFGPVSFAVTAPHRPAALSCSGVSFHKRVISRAPMTENGTIIHVHADQPKRSSAPPSANPVRPEARYCTPSQMPATVAAAFVPPKSIADVPESMPCTPKIHMHVNGMSRAAITGDVRLAEPQQRDDLPDVEDEGDRRTPRSEHAVRQEAAQQAAEDAADRHADRCHGVERHPVARCDGPPAGRGRTTASGPGGRNPCRTPRR